MVTKSVWGDEKFWKQVVLLASYTMNVVNATELYTYKWLKCQILCYIYVTTIKLFLKNGWEGFSDTSIQRIKETTWAKNQALV